MSDHHARKIVVTGGAGFIGSHLVDRLVARNAGEIIVVDNFHRGRPENLASAGESIRLISGDIRDRATVEEVLRDAEVVYHLAAQSNVMGSAADLDYSFSTNVNGTFEVLRAARKFGVERVVFASSREVYGDPESLPVSESAQIRPKNPYGASKAAGEAYCRAFDSTNTQVRVLRLTNIYGPRDYERVIPLFLQRAMRNQPLTIYGGGQLIDFFWIDYAVEAMLKAAELPNWPGPVNVGSGRATDLRELARRVIATTGSASEIRIASARNIEVAQFVAATERQLQYLEIRSPTDPLAQLPKLAEVQDQSGLRKMIVKSASLSS